MAFTQDKLQVIVEKIELVKAPRRAKTVLCTGQKKMVKTMDRVSWNHIMLTMVIARPGV